MPKVEINFKCKILHSKGLLTDYPNCATCTLGVGTLEAGFISDDGITTDTNSTQYKSLEGVFIQGCNQLVANNEEYLKFCTNAVTTFLPAIVSGLIRDYPADKLCQLFGLCAPTLK